MILKTTIKPYYKSIFLGWMPIGESRGIIKDMKIFKIAVTGSAGSGKSLVCQRFKELGLVTLDCDIIARQVVEPGMKGFAKIVELFGEKVLRENNTLNRSELRRAIINDGSLRKKMENILHPLISDAMVLEMETAAYNKVKAVAVEVPLLFETGMDEQFDISITVTAKDLDLIHRICTRDKVTTKEAKRMLDIQMSQEDKIARADHVIVNTGRRSELFDSVDKLFGKIQKEFLTR